MIEHEARENERLATLVEQRRAAIEEMALIEAEKAKMPRNIDREGTLESKIYHTHTSKSRGADPIPQIPNMNIQPPQAEQRSPYPEPTNFKAIIPGFHPGDNRSTSRYFRHSFSK